MRKLYYLQNAGSKENTEYILDSTNFVSAKESKEAEQKDFKLAELFMFSTDDLLLKGFENSYILLIF